MISHFFTRPFFYVFRKGGKTMPANVETMFYVREAPWHGLGTRVEEALTSVEALYQAGLDWRVVQKPIETYDGIPVPNFVANVRNSDDTVLGVVTDRYSIVQNTEAFAFTDALIGVGVTYETAGSLQNGRKVWILAKLPKNYLINGDAVEPYVVFMNSHDGSCSVKAAITPIRVVCQNTLNLALSTARRSWSAIHKGDIQGKFGEARETLELADHYMTELTIAAFELYKKKLSQNRVESMIRELIPVEEDMRDSYKSLLLRQREELLYRYREAPDLKDLENTGYRLLNAVADYADHTEPSRKRNNYRETLFGRVVDGHSLVDKAYIMLQAA